MPVPRRSLLLSPLAAPAAAASARAQGGPFPDRPIRVVIGYPPGGGVDTVGRPILQRLQERLGQPVVVENRAGANVIEPAWAQLKSAAIIPAQWPAMGSPRVSRSPEPDQ